MADYKVVDAQQLDADLATVADAIREQTGKADPIAFPDGFASAPAELVEVGRQKEWSDFWDNFQNYGKRTAYSNAFRTPQWNMANFKPKYDMHITDALCAFFEAKLTGSFDDIARQCGIVIDFDNCTTMEMTFHGTTLTRVGVVGSATALKIAKQTFGYAYKLTTIDKFIVNEKCTSFTNTFASCGKLENLTMEGTIVATISFASCPLTAASAKSVISCLKNFTGTGSENTTTVTFSTTTWGYLDEEGEASPAGTTWREYITNTLCWNC